MRIEHFAVQVEDPEAFADWYVSNCGMSIRSQMTEHPYMTFLADSAGHVMVEVYRNNAVEVPNYREMHHLLVHLAFVSKDPETDAARLQEAGATFVEEVRIGETLLIMLRDPWGLAIQLCKRSTRLLP